MEAVGGDGAKWPPKLVRGLCVKHGRINRPDCTRTANPRVEAYIGFYPPLHSTPTFENIATGNVRES